MMRKDEILRRLFSLADPGYRDFSASLMPGVARERVIGVRTPALRQLARELWDTPTAEAFLLDLPHRYFEENQLHAFLCEREGDVTAALARCKRFLPYIDNWATCDQFVPRAFARAPEALSDVLPVWLASDHPYTVRYAILARMRYFLCDERFLPRYPEEIAGVRMGWHYYVDMAVAWYFATAAAKQEEAARPFLLTLPPAVRNKAIAKARESFRVPPAVKEELARLRVPGVPALRPY